MARLPHPSGKHLVKALESRGWYVHHQHGSHVVLRHPGHVDVRIVVPCHGSKPVAKGTLGRILKDADLTGDDLRGLL